MNAIATAPDKVYDGSTAAAPVLTIASGLVGVETLAVTATGRFNSKDVATANQVTVDAVSLTDGGNGGLAANYLVVAGQTASARIVPKVLTVNGASGITKTYDGTAAMAVGTTGQGGISGLIMGDAVTVTGAPVFDTANAGVRSITQGSVVLVGADTGNYTLAWQNGAGRIDRAPLQVTANADAKLVTQGDGMGYNGAYFAGFVNGETGSVLGGTLAIARSNTGEERAGRYTGVLMPAGLTSSNYDIRFQAGDYTIVPAGQLLVRFQNTSSVYGSAPSLLVASAQYLDNGNQIRTLDAPVIAGNSFRFDDGVGGIAAFSVAPAAPQRSGAGVIAVGNYGLMLNDISQTSANFSNQLVVIGNVAVTPKPVSVNGATGIAKVYDGGTGIMGATVGFDGNLVGDSLNVTGNGAFGSKNVGSGLAYGFTGLTLGGTDAGNYVLIGGTTLTGTDGVITPKSLLISGIVAADKVYDGNLTARIDTSPALRTGLVAGDDVSIAATGKFADKNVGIGKAVALTGSTGGADASNYDITFQPTATATISRLPVAIWQGGPTGNWFDPGNWLGGAVPDLANVAEVRLPVGVTVNFGAPVVAPAEAGTVQLDRLIGDGARLVLDSGDLQIGAGGLRIDALVRAGGTLTSLGPLDVSTSKQAGAALADAESQFADIDAAFSASGAKSIEGRLASANPSRSAAPLMIYVADGREQDAADATVSFVVNDELGRPVAFEAELAGQGMRLRKPSASARELVKRAGNRIVEAALTAFEQQLSIDRSRIATVTLAWR